ncbi:MAG TPA: glutathione S-transferase family protein [Lysobacter sp.]|nr:glutathione S-transferase family protein [Lysobacter sp.]
MPTLVIGNKNYSSWSLRPWLLLRHFGVAFEEVRLPLDTPEFEAAIGRWSPTRRVPVLHDDGVVVWDSLAICEYANERWLDGAGWPAGRAERALARAAAAEMHSGFAQLREQLPMNVRRVPDRYRWDERAQADIDRVQALWRELRERCGGDGEFLCGAFGIVDAMFAPVVYRFLGYGVTMDDTARRWCEAMLALPAMRAWREAALAESERIAATDARVMG